MADAMKLLPCPFCGDDDPEITGENGWVWIACTTGSDCACRGPDSDDEASAIEAWNRRASPPAREEPPELALEDAKAFGIGFIVDGQRVSPDRVTVCRGEEAPAEGAGEPMSEREVRQWIDACNHEPGRQVLRDYLALRNRTSEPEAGGGITTQSMNEAASDPVWCAKWNRDPSAHPAPATADKLKVAKEALERITEIAEVVAARTVARQALAALEGGEG